MFSTPQSERSAGLPRLGLRHRELLVELAKREILDRYAHQLLGGVWAFAHPLFLMTLYVSLFTIVFPTRGPAGGSVVDGAIFMLSGLVPWLAVNETLSRSPSVLPAHASLVKQIVFPIEVLPLKTLAPPLFNLALFLSLILATAIISRRDVGAGVFLLLPAAFFLNVLTMVGLSFGLSAVAPFFRDIREIITVFSAAGLFLTPIFYPPARLAELPDLLRLIVVWNPFSHLIWCYQDALYYGRVEHPLSWLGSVLFAALSVAVGYGTFRRLKPMFGDAL